MSAESIEARTHELMSMQKIELARALAEHEDAAVGYIKPVFAHSEPHTMEQGTDPVVLDIAPASTQPEPLSEPSNAAMAQEIQNLQSAGFVNVQEVPAGEDSEHHIRMELPAASVEGADAEPKGAAQ